MKCCFCSDCDTVTLEDDPPREEGVFSAPLYMSFLDLLQENRDKRKREDEKGKQEKGKQEKGKQGRGEKEKGHSRKRLRREENVPLSVCRSGLLSSGNTFGQPPVDLGIASWNVHHGGDEQEMKNASIQRLFAQNPWLDILVLQEVRAEVIKLSGERELDVCYGPLLRGVSRAKRQASPKSKGAKTFGIEVSSGSKTSTIWVTPRQQEYYPIVFRADTVKVRSVWAYHGEKACSEQVLYWAKEKHELPYPSTRPIIIYDVEVDGRLLHVAVVHTTPEDSGLARKQIYTQFKPFLEMVAEHRDHWVIAGDYYLDPEASIHHSDPKAKRGRSDLFKTAVGGMGLELVISLSATNESAIRYGGKGLGAAALVELYKEDERSRRDRVLRVVESRGKEVEMVMVDQRADFFICTKGFQVRQGGLMAPSGGLLLVDPEHNALQWWTRISDHVPVGAVLCTSKTSQRHRLLAERHEEAFFERLNAADRQIRKTHEAAVYELSSSQQNLVRYIPRLEVNRLLLARFCLFVDSILDDPLCTSLGSHRVHFDRQKWAEATKDVQDDELVHYLKGVVSRGDDDDAIDEEASISSEEEEESELMGKAEEIRQKLLDDVTPSVEAGIRAAISMLNLLGYTIADFDLTPEDETYEDVDPLESTIGKSEVGFV